MTRSECKEFVKNPSSITITLEKLKEIEHSDLIKWDGKSKNPSFDKRMAYKLLRTSLEELINERIENNKLSKPLNTTERLTICNTILEFGAYLDIETERE